MLRSVIVFSLLGSTSVQGATPCPEWEAVAFLHILEINSPSVLMVHVQAACSSQLCSEPPGVGSPVRAQPILPCGWQHCFPPVLPHMLGSSWCPGVQPGECLSSPLPPPLVNRSS